MSPRSVRSDEVLELALGVLERNGLEAFSIVEVARAAGVKPPSLYKQFDGKADIEARLIEIGFRMQGDTTARAMSALGPAPTRRMIVEMLVRAYRDFGHRHPQLYRLMHERPLPPTLSAEAYMARGETYRSLFDDPSVATSFWAWAHGLLTLELAGRYEAAVDVDRIWEILIERLSAELG
ncbi:TetR/AcrR family transcriptional regulator [Parafrigoribacterium soli]|uniref:TetR/AcrR family transcriptional regulator n=1 Tax=Parafrigoribacterium soli TaxID=3144663 RepID=UPI0032F03468